MGLVAIDSGSITTDGSEQTLSTQTTAAFYVLVVDTGLMVDNDAIEVRIKTKARSGDPSRLAYQQTYVNLQGQPQKYSVPVPSDVELIATIKRIAGTDRAYPWKLLIQ